MNLNEENPGFEENESGHEETHESHNDVQDKISRLESSIYEIKDLISKQVQGGAGKSAAESVEVTDEQALQLAKDPAKLANFIQSKINEGLATFNKNVASKSWDDKAYDEYPVLKEDKKFQDAVKKEIQDLIASGDMTKSSPRLVYVATQLAASKHGFAKKSATSSQQQSRSGGATSLPANSGAGASRGSSKSSVADNDPRLVLAQKLGWSKERLDSYKEKLAGKETKRINIPKGRSILR